MYDVNTLLTVKHFTKKENVLASYKLKVSVSEYYNEQALSDRLKSEMASGTLTKAGQFILCCIQLRKEAEQAGDSALVNDCSRVITLCMDGESN